MSVIRKKPFIEYLIDDLTAEQKQSLLDAVNGSGNTVDASLSNMPASAITPVLFQFDANDSKTGILIQSTSYRVLICYHRFQDLLMFKFDAQNNYQKINEYLDINELRRLLEEVKDHVVASEIDSGEADAGLVLTADGEGGASWENMSDVFTEDNVNEGDAVKLFGFDASGNLVQDDIPEGIVVDETIIEDSTNAVAGGAVYDALADIDAELETKANVDGNYPTMTVGVADQLSPYDEESGDDQDEPFSFQATGTGNGTQPDFATGAIALMKEKQGNTVCVNQLVPNNLKNYTSADTDTKDYFSLQLQIYSNNSWITLHTQNITSVGLFEKNITPTVDGTRFRFKHNGSQQDIVILNFETNVFANHTYHISILFKGIDVQTVGGVVANEQTIKDLTQWFNGDIPADLLDNPENFFRYYQGSLAYNEGELVNANGRYIKCIGRQQWDEEEFNIGKGVNSTTGELDASKINWNSSGFIKVIPNYSYKLYVGINTDRNVFFYDKDSNYIGYQSLNSPYLFSTPSNCLKIRFEVNKPTYGNTYNHDITISLYYEGESGYDQYYPYEVLTNNDTGTEVLRGAGSVKDYKTPDGTIHRLVEYVDLSTLTWSYDDANRRFYSNVISELKSVATDTDIGSLTSDKYSPIAVNSITGVSTYDKVVATSASKRVYIRDDSLTGSQTPTGTLYYELAEPTTEQGTPYSENLVIDDFGSMDFQGTNGVPQGNLIFYPVDYKAFIDTLYDYTEGTPSNIALKNDIDDTALNARGYYKQVDLSSGITDVAGLTYDLKKAYKVGNVVLLTIRAKNETGNSISSGSTLFTLGSGVIPNTGLRFIVYANDTIGNVYASNDGSCNCSVALPNGTYIILCVSYAVA